MYWKQFIMPSLTSHMRMHAYQIWGQIQSKTFDIIQCAQKKSFKNYKFQTVYGCNLLNLYITNCELII